MLILKDLIHERVFCMHNAPVWCYVYIETCSQYKEKSLVSAMQIAYQMYGTYDVPRNTVTSISESIRELIDSGMLIGERVGKQYYVIDRESFNYKRWISEGRQYIDNVDVEDIRKIFAEHKRPFAVLCYYLLILSTINSSTGVGISKNETIADLVGGDAETITRYFNILEKLKLLYIYRGMYRSNTYGRYKDKEAIIAAGNERSSKKQVKSDSNKRRKYTQRYNQVRARNPKYINDRVLMEDIYAVCSYYNDRAEEHGEPRIYDLSVFENLG